MLNWIETNPVAGIVILAWTIAWKGFGLWKAAERQQKWWFIAILLINTFGILEIIYLTLVAKRHKVEVVEN